VAGEHRGGINVDKGVDFRGRDGASEGGKHRRGQQYVTVMAQLGYEYAMDF
jgi:hypothetical protein